MTKLERLNAFFAARETAGDWHAYLNRAGSQLNRKSIVEDCQFPRSTLYQTSAIQQRITEMEANLAQRGILVARSAAESSAPELDGEVNQQIEALNDRMNALLGGIQEVQALIASFDPEAVLAP